MFGAPKRIRRPDPILTNVMIDESKQGGWIGSQLCAIKPVASDYVRYGQEDSKSLLSNFHKTARAAGTRYNLLPRPVREWFTAQVDEDALRAEYTDEDVELSISPEEPRVNCARKIGNALAYVFEYSVASLYDPSTFDSANKDSAGASWSGSASKIVEDVEKAKLVVLRLTGMMPNFIRIPIGKMPGIITCDEFRNNEQGVFLPLVQHWMNGEFNVPFLGLKPVFGVGRWDSTSPGGAFTPTFVWDDPTLHLDNTVHIGYSPTLNGGNWSGDQQAFIGCFETRLPNEPGMSAAEYKDPYYNENHTHIVYGNARRSAPQVFNPDLCFAITGI